MKKRYLLQLAAAAAFVYMLTRPQTVGDSVRSGLEFCAAVIIPSLFVYMVLSDTFYGAASIFPGRAFPAALIVMGILCGSPSGADSVRQMYDNGDISKRQAECLLAVCGNASASFIISFAGGAVMGSVRAGVMILAAKLTLSFLSWHVTARCVLPEEERRIRVRRGGGGRTFPQAIEHAVTATANVCACVVFFTVISDLAASCCAQEGYARCLIHGALEFSGGLGECAALEKGARYTAACALIGWQGMCVHLQVSVAAGNRLSLKTYFSVKVAETCAMTLFGLLTKGLAV